MSVSFVINDQTISSNIILNTPADHVPVHTYPSWGSFAQCRFRFRNKWTFLIMQNLNEPALIMSHAWSFIWFIQHNIWWISMPFSCSIETWGKVTLTGLNRMYSVSLLAKNKAMLWRVLVSLDFSSMYVSLTTFRTFSGKKKKIYKKMNVCSSTGLSLGQSSASDWLKFLMTPLHYNSRWRPPLYYLFLQWRNPGQ